MPGDAVAVGLDVEKIAAIDALGIGRRGAGNGAQGGFDLAGDPFELDQIGPEDLDADRRADAGRKHVDAGLDGHRPGVGDAGKLQRGVHFGNQPVEVHAPPPFAFRPQVDDGLEHFHRRGIGRGVGAARLAPDRGDLGKGGNDPVLRLQKFGRLRHRKARQRGRHVEKRPLVEVRHEFRTDAAERHHRDGEHEDSGEDGHAAGAQHQRNDGPVEPDQRLVERIFGLRHDPAANEDRHQHRHQRDREKRGGRHRKGLGRGKRLEEPAFLRLQREDRQEGDGDDQQAEKERRAHFLRRLDDDGAARSAGRRMLEPLVGILDHHDRRIDHGADRNRNAAKAHDVGRNTERMGGGKRNQNADRQRDDGNKRAACMPEEQKADQRHDDAFLDERAHQRVDGAADELGAVIDLDDFGVAGQARRNGRKLPFDVFDDVERIGAMALQGDAGDRLALAAQFGDAAPLVGREFDARHVAQQKRRAALGAEHDLLDILDAGEIAAAADHEFGFGKLDGAAADIHVAGAHRAGDVGQRQTCAFKQKRIDDDRILPHEAAHRCDLGDAIGARNGEADLPVLQRAELGEVQLRGFQRILIDPADAGRIRPERRRHAVGQAFGRRTQIFEDTASRPVEIGAVLEDDIDEGNAEEGKAAHDARARHVEHRGCEREGHLILDDLRRLAGIIGDDDDLRVRQVRYRVERNARDRIDAGDDRKERADQYQNAVARRPADNARDHGATVSAVKAESAAWRLLSASIRKMP